MLPSNINEPLLPLPIIKRKGCSCGQPKCPCVNLAIGTVETLAPTIPAFVDVEKAPDACDYELSFGIPQGVQGAVGPKGPKGDKGDPGKCECPITLDDRCYIFVSTDGAKVKGCIERQGVSDTFMWKFTEVS